MYTYVQVKIVLSCKGDKVDRQIYAADYRPLNDLSIPFGGDYKDFHQNSTKSDNPTSGIM